jgi:aminoglycoside phosphotransferase family enzyme/predicted kinase
VSDQHNSDQPDQDAALAFLDREVRAGRAKRVDTHASIVFLEPDRVLKIKRAVRLPFLDYSTLEKRKQACEAELDVNRRFAPHIYRCVVPIRRGAAGPEIGGSGPVIEWAVEMARFDEGKTFDHLARAGALTPALGEAMADELCDAHRRADISDGADWLASLGPIIDRNSSKFRAHASLPREQVERLHAWSHRRLAAALPLLQARAHGGLVRRCHGDAHLGNIVLIEDRPVLFDAIEFDPVIATTDILYDLAFPLMDLLHFGLDEAANRLFNRYLERDWQESAGALSLLPLFLSIRAAIRALVLLTRCEQSPGDVQDLMDAKSYFDLALSFLEPARPSLVAIGGRSGTGKSVLARHAAPRIEPLPGAVILRTDVIRKQLCGVDPLARLPQSAYTAEITARVYRTLHERAGEVIAQGFSVILDAAFLREAERDGLAADARTMAADFRPIFLDADLAVRVKRIASRKHDASDATGEVATEQESYDIGRLDWPVVDASGSPEQTLERSLPPLGVDQGCRT